MKKRYEDGRVPPAVESLRGSLAARVRELRRSEDLTQEELASIIGTKKSNISRLESGRYNPSLDFMVKVVNGLGKNITIEIE
jgi:transcriptional regulator with XRE-family HTH domain